jgi:endo-1,4-beta-xylanase
MLGRKEIVAFALAGLLLAALALVWPLKAAEDTLRQYAERDHLLIGVELQEIMMHQDPAYKPVAGKEFNLGASISFMRLTQPQQGRFNFQNMDWDIAFAREHNMKLLGHVLVYRPQSSAPWLNFDRPNCGGWSASALEQVLKTHIQTLVRHGGDNFYGWEVVNEDTPFHNGCWGKVLGQEDYIAKAFQFAHEANPQAKLLLNETFGHAGIDQERERAFFTTVRKLKARGVPIDQVGAELHLEAGQLHPNYLDEIRGFLKDARDAGVQAEFTELDVYQGLPGSFPDLVANQKKIFHDVTRVCLEDSGCVALLTWGLSDKNNWPATRPRDPLLDAAPLLFDSSYQRKPAYYGVLEALKEGR